MPLFVSHLLLPLTVIACCISLPPGSDIHVVLWSLESSASSVYVRAVVNAVLG